MSRLFPGFHQLLAPLGGALLFSATFLALTGPSLAEVWYKEQWSGGDAQRCYKVWNEQKNFCESKGRQGTLDACVKVAKQRFLKCCYPKMEGINSFAEQHLEERFKYCSNQMKKLSAGVVLPVIGAAGQLAKDAIPGQQITRGATIAKKLILEGVKQGTDFFTPKPPSLRPETPGTGGGVGIPGGVSSPGQPREDVPDAVCPKCNKLVVEWKQAYADWKKLKGRLDEATKKRTPLADDAARAKAELDRIRAEMRRHNKGRNKAAENEGTNKIWTEKKYKLMDGLEAADIKSGKLDKELGELDAKLANMRAKLKDLDAKMKRLRKMIDDCRKKPCEKKKTAAAVPVPDDGEPVTGLAFQAAPVEPIPELAPPVDPVAKDARGGGSVKSDDDGGGNLPVFQGGNEGATVVPGSGPVLVEVPSAPECKEPEPIPLVRWICPQCRVAAETVNTHVKLFNRSNSQFTAAVCEKGELVRQIALLHNAIVQLTGDGRKDAVAKAGEKKAGLQGRLPALDTEIGRLAGFIPQLMGLVNKTRRFLYNCETLPECRKWTKDIYPDISEFDTDSTGLVIGLGIPALDDFPLLPLDPNTGTLMPGSGGTGFLPLPDVPERNYPPIPPTIQPKCPDCEDAADMVNELSKRKYTLESRAASARYRAAVLKREKVVAHNKWTGERFKFTDEAALDQARTAYDAKQSELDGELDKAKGEAAELESQAKKTKALMDEALTELEKCDHDKCLLRFQKSLRDAIEGRRDLFPEPTLEERQTDGLPEDFDDGPDLRDKVKRKTGERLRDAEATKPKPKPLFTQPASPPVTAVGPPPPTGETVPTELGLTEPSPGTPSPTFQPPQVETIYQEEFQNEQINTYDCSVKPYTGPTKNKQAQQSLIDNYNANCP